MQAEAVWALEKTKGELGQNEEGQIENDGTKGSLEEL
jgi:hypothetical protein